MLCSPCCDYRAWREPVGTIRCEHIWLKSVQIISNQIWIWIPGIINRKYFSIRYRDNICDITSKTSVKWSWTDTILKNSKTISKGQITFSQYSQLPCFGHTQKSRVYIPKNLILNTTHQLGEGGKQLNSTETHDHFPKTAFSSWVISAFKMVQTGVCFCLRAMEQRKPYPFKVAPKFIWFQVMHSSWEVIWYKLSLLEKYPELETHNYKEIYNYFFKKQWCFTFSLQRKPPCFPKWQNIVSLKWFCFHPTDSCTVTHFTQTRKAVRVIWKPLKNLSIANTEVSEKVLNLLGEEAKGSRTLERQHRLDNSTLKLKAWSWK